MVSPSSPMCTPSFHWIPSPIRPHLPSRALSPSSSDSSFSGPQHWPYFQMVPPRYPQARRGDCPHMCPTHVALAGTFLGPGPPEHPPHMLGELHCLLQPPLPHHSSSSGAIWPLSSDHQEASYPRDSEPRSDPENGSRSVWLGVSPACCESLVARVCGPGAENEGP